MTSTIVKSLAVSRNGGNERPLFDLQRLKPATARGGPPVGAAIGMVAAGAGAAQAIGAPALSA